MWLLKRHLDNQTSVSPDLLQTARKSSPLHVNGIYLNNTANTNITISFITQTTHVVMILLGAQHTLAHMFYLNHYCQWDCLLIKHKRGHFMGSIQWWIPLTTSGSYVASTQWCKTHLLKYWGTISGHCFFYFIFWHLTISLHAILYFLLPRINLTK